MQVAPALASPASSLTSWYVDVDGPVHVGRFGGPQDAPAVVCVHGLGSSHVSWWPLARELTASFQVYAIDLPGHGRSPAQGRSAKVQDNCDVVARVLDELIPAPVTLLGHSMGAAVSVLVASSQPERVTRLGLIAPPMPRHGLSLLNAALLPYVALCLWPRLGHLALRHLLGRTSLEQRVLGGAQLTYAGPDQVSDLVPLLAAELEASHITGEDALATFLAAARSVGSLVVTRGAYRRSLARVTAPAWIVQGAEDRVLKPAALEQLRHLQPAWRTHVLPGIGHSPHLENPSLAAQLLCPS